MTLIGTGMKRGLFAAAALAGLMALGADPALARGTGNMGGAPATHSGALNTNGPNATDRDFGRDRAGDRNNANSRLHDTSFTGHGRDGNNGRFNNHRWRHGRHHHYGWR